MKAIYTVLIWVCPFLLSAQNRGELDHYTKMLEINSQWRYHQADCPKETTHFDSDIDAIQAHLFLVCESLIKNTPKHLNEKQLTKRMQLIEELRGYAEGKVFPTNLYHTTRTPYFVDDFGVHCAVGFLMKQSGFTDLVATIRANENYAYIEEIKAPGVAEWAEEHGFTVDELKWIQPGYSNLPAYQITSIGSGANGPVNKMLVLSSLFDGHFIFAGDFDSLDLIPCLNIGRYNNNQLTCLGEGLSGKINDIASSQGRIVVFGLFEFEDQEYSIASFYQGEWQYMNIPSRSGAIATAGFSTGVLNYFEVAINHPDYENVQEVWFTENAIDWHKRLAVNGTINTIKSTFLSRVYAGNFSEASSFDIDGNLESTIATNNVVFRNHNSSLWEALNSTEISDTVNAIFTVGTQIYFGGTSLNDDLSNGVVLSRFFNHSVQPLLYASSFLGNDPISIYCIQSGITPGSLLLGGNFHFTSVMYPSGKNLANLDVYTNRLDGVVVLNEPVYALAYATSQICFGGDFQVTFGSTQLNHLGRIVQFLGLDEHHPENPIQVFPNPTGDVIHVSGINSSSPYQIFDLNGRVVLEGTVHESSMLDLSGLLSGVYVLQVQLESGVVSSRIVKQ